MLRRILAALLCTLLVVSSLFLVSCDKSDETSSGGAAGENTADGFLNEAKNFEGQTVTFLSYKGKSAFATSQVEPEGITDEPVNDAFYKRNSLISERFGIDIEKVVPEGEMTTTDMLRADVTSNLGEYDAIVAPLTEVIPLAVDGLLYDFNTINNKYLHLDQAWWDQGLMEDLSINDKVFCISGDALVDDDESTWAMYFNKDLIAKYNLESPYQLVKDGKWTIDKLYEMARVAHLSHDSVKSFQPDDGDIWGMIMQSYDFYMLMQGCGQRMVDATGDIPTLRIDAEENVDVFMDVANIVFDAQNIGVADFHGSWMDGIYTTERQLFAAGGALFMPGGISYVSLTELREANINYGILPLPKRSELQEEYVTPATVYDYAVFGLPISNIENVDITCYAMEAMAYYGKQLVTPEYYERTLTLKRFEDTESEAMLDIIFGNRIYDMGAVFNFHGEGIDPGYGTLYFYTNILWTKKSDIISPYERSLNSFQAGIDELIALAYNN